MQTFRLSIASFLALATFGSAATTAVDSLWSDNFNFNTPIRDALGVPLTNGSALDGDGAVIQIGYFSGISPAINPATFGPAQWATFTPISGNGSANPHFATSMGDGTGGFFPDGFYTLGVTWDTTPPSGPASVGLPTSSARIGIRFFDATTVAASTGSNIVTSFHADWVMGPPSNTPTAPRSASVDARAASSPTDPAPGLVWEDASHPFQTIPEPSGGLLGLFGLAFLLRRRR